MLRSFDMTLRTSLGTSAVSRLVRGLALLTLLLSLNLSVGSGSAQAGVENGQRFKDWMGRCEKGKDEKGSEIEVCYISQRLIMKDGKRPVLEVSIGYMRNDAKPAAFFTVPLGVTLPPGMQIQIDEAKPIRIPFAYCRETGCIAPMPLQSDFISRLKKGAEAKVTFIDGLGQQVPVPVSLQGFTAGFNALDKP